MSCACPSLRLSAIVKLVVVYHAAATRLLLPGVWRARTSDDVVVQV